MSDTVPSQSKGLLKRQRSASFTPRSDTFFDNDFVPSYASTGFGAVFANDTSDVVFSRFEDDGVSSNGYSFDMSMGQAREPLDDLNPYLNPDFMQRTRSQEIIRNQREKDIWKELLFDPGVLIPRATTVTTRPWFLGQ